DREGREVARIEADRVRTERNCPRQLLLVVGLDKGIETEAGGDGRQPRGFVVVEVAQQQQDRVRAASFELDQLVGLAEEPFRQERQRRGRTCGPQIVERARESLVHEDGDGRGACALELAGQSSGLRVGTQVAGRGRAPLDLRDRRQTRTGESVAELHAVTAGSRENALRASSRSPAAPESIASRARPTPSAMSLARPPAAIAPAAFRSTAS